MIHLAYIGPGIGAGVVSVVVGFVASIIFAIIAIFWYPLKRMMGWIRRRRTSKAQKID